MESFVQSVGNALRESALWRLAALGGLVLLLLLPVQWVRDLVDERLQRRVAAVAEVSEKWGGAQEITGPVLVLPYSPDGKPYDTAQRHESLTIVPEQVRIRARIAGEVRRRGIFAVPVYRTELDVGGQFGAPDLASLGIGPEAVGWEHAVLAVGVSDAGAIQRHAVLSWSGAEMPFNPGTATFTAIDSGIHARVSAPLHEQAASFSFPLVVNGSSGLYFEPLGKQTAVEVESDWPSPSFQGSWLPTTREVSGKGFHAVWQVPLLARNQPLAWTSTGTEPRLGHSRFGVDLVTVVDEHRMTERSVKYAHLFLALTFGTIWLVEVLAGVRVHPIQYLLVGAALCAFYLLELSLAEQLGFPVAYAAASGAVFVLVGSYATAVLRGARRAAGVAAVIGGLYAYLYVVLVNEDYALLMGSLGLFLAIALTMFLTRRLDWYAIGAATRRESAAG